MDLSERCVSILRSRRESRSGLRVNMTLCFTCVTVMIVALLMTSSVMMMEVQG
jgi:hypothetical protein